MEPQVYGYARALTRNQPVDDQLEVLRGFGIEESRVFVDAFTRKGPGRSQYKRLVRRLHKGDTLVVKSLDCLGRSGAEILAEWEAVTKGKGADIVVLDVPLLDTRVTPYNAAGEIVKDVVLQLLRSVVQIERDARQRVQAEGIASAKAQGVRCGRPALPQPDNFEAVYASYDRREITRKEAAAQLGVGVATFDKWCRARRQNG